MQTNMKQAVHAAFVPAPELVTHFGMEIPGLFCAHRPEVMRSRQTGSIAGC